MPSLNAELYHHPIMLAMHYSGIFPTRTWHMKVLLVLKCLNAVIHVTNYSQFNTQLKKQQFHLIMLRYRKINRLFSVYPATAK